MKFKIFAFFSTFLFLILGVVSVSSSYAGTNHPRIRVIELDQKDFVPAVAKHKEACISILIKRALTPDPYQTKWILDESTVINERRNWGYDFDFRIWNRLAKEFLTGVAEVNLKRIGGGVKGYICQLKGRQPISILNWRGQVIWAIKISSSMTIDEPDI